MDIAILGLGRMGGNMARRMLRGGHRVILWNRTTETAEKIMAEAGAGEVVRNVADLRQMLAAPRRVWPSRAMPRSRRKAWSSPPDCSLPR